MKVEIKIEKDCVEPKIIVVTDKMTEELSNAVKYITQSSAQVIIGYKDDTAEILDRSDIVRIYSANKHVYAVKGNTEYRLGLALYKLEEILDGNFVRISNSEIVNLKHVKKLGLSLAGTICISLSNKDVTYASRRYISKIKQILGI